MKGFYLHKFWNISETLTFQCKLTRETLTFYYKFHSIFYGSLQQKIAQLKVSKQDYIALCSSFYCKQTSKQVSISMLTISIKSII